MTTETLTRPTLTNEQVTPPIWARALIAGAATAAINLVLLFIGKAAGAAMTMSNPSSPEPMAIGWIPVVIASIAPLALAGLVTWLLARQWPKVRVWSAWVGFAFGILSIAALASSPDWTTALSLGAMHVVAGVAWFLAMTLRIPANNQ